MLVSKFCLLATQSLVKLCSFCVLHFMYTDNFDIAGRYVAPEVLRNEEYDAKVDVFSFSLILQEVSVVIMTLHISHCHSNLSQTKFKP
jgi:hypothetical protein